MYYYEIAPTTIVRTNQSYFTYHSDLALKPGNLVRIPVGKKEVNGVIFKVVNKPVFDTKPVISTLELKPLPSRLLKLATWLQEYYSTPTPIVLQTLLPSGLQKKRHDRQLSTNYPERLRTKFVLNSEQKRAIEVIKSTKKGTLLLKGHTGSGKTRVYIEAAKQASAHGQSTIVLVPEIALTPQLVAEFRHDFNDDQLLITHSKMTEAERHLVWRFCLETDKPKIVIGPRSALFMPLPKLGLIVVDEEHEPSYKQDQAPRYSTVRAASAMATFNDIKVILGSATPSIIDYYLANISKQPILHLTKPAIPGSRAPSVELVSFQNRNNFTKHRFFSNSLLQKISQAIDEGTQVLLFHNRRGTAPITVCGNCGWNALCPNCYVPLTLHGDKYQLLCHLCGHDALVPRSCPTCHNPDINHKGIGTKLVAEEAAKLFPNVQIARFDADNSIAESLQTNYQSLYNGDIQLIIGTQVIAKGLDLPKLSVVGVLQADSSLYLPDYQAEERIFQLLYQVAGRVGRQPSINTSVIIQTYQPNHPVITYGLQKDYMGFYEHAIAGRQQGLFPPFTYLLKLTCVYNTETAALQASRKLATKLRTKYSTIQVLGPTPAFYERLGGKYRWQLLLKSKQRSTLQKIAAEVPKPWQHDLDPHSLL